MTTTVEKNNPKIFPKNEGKVNSKGMIAPQVPPRAPEAKLSSQNELEKVVKLEKIAPPVPPKSYQTKFAGIKAIFEQDAQSKSSGKQFKHVNVPLNTVGDMLFGGVNGSTPYLKPQGSRVSTTAFSDSGKAVDSNVTGFSSTMQQIIKNTNTAQKSENSSNANLTPVKEKINLFNNMNKEQSSTTHKQEPLSEVSKVKVEDVVEKGKVRGLVSKFEQGGRGC